MADPFRLRILKAISAQIKTVTPANGYSVDLSDYTDEAGRPALRVFRGRDAFGENDPLPMVAVLEDPRSLEASNASDDETPATVGQYRLLVQGFIEDDRENPTDPAYPFAADVITALVKAKADKYDILGLGPTMPCITKLSIGQPVVRPADNEVSSVSFFFLALTLTLVEDLENPYA